jgi:DNA processing protein
MEQLMPDTRDCIALWAVPGIGSLMSRKLVAYTGGIKNIFKLKNNGLQKIPGIGPQLAHAIIREDYYRKADEVLEFATKFQIQIITWYDEKYPVRLKQCDDSPLVIFVKGQQLVDNRKYIAMVGTRNATQRGTDFCNDFIGQLKARNHDVCIVSGLAYGIDIAAHKASLNHNIPTIGILGHGLDTMYPATHRKTAADIIKEGSLITEFFPGVFPDKNNFVRRNRIIAGLSDAVIVVESDVKGGALITAQLANSYSREVFALPGRISDRYSSGCNWLIKTNQANLMESLADVEYQLGWDDKPKVIQKQLFVELQPDEQIIYDLLQKQTDTPIDLISRETGLTMPKVSALLLNMEFNGLVKCLPGKVFTLA